MIKRLNKRVTAKQILREGKYISDKNSPFYIKDKQKRILIAKDFFKGLSQMIVEEAFEYKIPHGLGRIYIRRWRPKRKHMAIDWYNTKKYGKRIYHRNTHSGGYTAMWKWDKWRTLAKGISLYLFTPTRTNHRDLAKAIKEKNLITEYRVLL